jgi:hypothetical protein
MQLKDGVDPSDVHPVLWLFLGEIAGLYREATGEEMVITSLRRPPSDRASRHSPGLGHPCMAADIRRWPFKDVPTAARFARELQQRFGHQLGVVLEPEWLTPREVALRGGPQATAGHIHVELKDTAWPASL